MGLFQYYSKDEYYTRVDPKEFKLGQICWIATPAIDPIPRILDVERNQPEEHDEVKFELKNVDPDHSFRGARNRILPIKYLNLESNEELLVQKAKRRPAIIISGALDTYPEITALLRQRSQKHLQEDSFFLIPCYSVQTRDSRRGFPPAMVAKIRCMLYRQFFPLRVCPPLANDSIARMDRIQVVTGKHRAAIDPTDLCLSDSLFQVLLAQFLFCMSGVEEKELADLRSLAKESYKEHT